MFSRRGVLAVSAVGTMTATAVRAASFGNSDLPAQGAINGRMTAGDIGYVKRNCGRYGENTGDTNLQFIGVFRAPRYEEVSLSNWLDHTPPALVARHLNVDPPTIAKWPRNSPGVMPNMG
jgi:oxalate decarboxylase/phosphoglucose isomerase-like protein (cupin superfamily)